MTKMHKNEVILSVSEIREMLHIQFPDWSSLSINPIDSAGTVNAIYQLGDHLCIRLPRIYSGVEQIEKEAHWLPRLSTYLSLQIPTPIALGEPSEKYPWKWAVYNWIEGVNALPENLSDLQLNVKILANFIISLQSMDTFEGLKPGHHNYHRGEALVNRNEITRKTFLKLKNLGLIDLKIAEQVWDDALNAPVEENEITWIHGDLQSGNMLAKQGKIQAIIDFGALAVGDAACDLMPAWNLWGTQERDTFLNILTPSENMLKRARGWSISVATIALEYYLHTNPGLAKISKYTIQEIEKEF